MSEKKKTFSCGTGPTVLTAETGRGRGCGGREGRLSRELGRRDAADR